MEQSEKTLGQWIEENNLSVNKINNVVFEIADKTCIKLQPKGGKIVDENFELIISEKEQLLIDQHQVTHYVFMFGDDYCISPVSQLVTLDEFRYLGKPNLMFDIPIPYLGVHGKYELCNGSRHYEDWCKKAKFLNYTALGLCELNTLAGTLSFQKACVEAEIKSIIGETCTIVDGEKRYHIKLYVQNQEGWENLLQINAEINVHNNGVCSLDSLLNFSQGLVAVLCNDFPLDGIYLNRIKKKFKHIYYQVDCVEYSSDNTDREYLTNLNIYLRDFSKLIKPILVCDSYYLEQPHWYIKDSLNKIGKVGFNNHSKNQHFKTIDEIFMFFAQFIQTDSVVADIVSAIAESCIEVEFLCDYTIPSGTFKLPEYNRTEQESKLYEDNTSMFYELIQQGVSTRILCKGEQMYQDRIIKELAVIEQGGFVDYFLIHWDFIRWAKSQDILVGIGRGSVGGCLIAYLLDITQIDPLKYDLLFERFLNEARIHNSLPDIDIDFEGSRRDEIKHYMEQRYGVDNVTSIGSFSTFKARASIESVGRLKSIAPQQMSYYNAMIEAECDYTDIFRNAALQQPSILKQFISKNPTVFRDIKLIYGQPKNSSIHASGVVITPIHFGSIFKQIPVKKIDDVLVSEWEGEYIEEAGFLKEDILGIKQLEKFKAILKLIKETTGDEIDIYNLELDDQMVYDKFRAGMNEDVFQLGASGLKSYCFQLKPDNIDDLIATVSLYRPGPIDAQIHLQYVQAKNYGKQIVLDHPKLEPILKNTRGLIIYQEQIMFICEQLAGFNLVEADDVRRAMGKKKADLLESYKERFIKGCGENKVDKSIAIKIWKDIEGFAGYAFNKSHAAAYAITGYICQWLKVHYPIQFWSVSLQYAKDKISNRLAELAHEHRIFLAPPNINKPSSSFSFDTKSNTIFWSLSEISNIGPVKQSAIESMINSIGEVFSFKEFLTHLPNYTGIDKRSMTHLILSGAFDTVEKITTPTQRLDLLSQLGNYYGQKDFIIDYVSPLIDIPLSHHLPNYEWTKIQRKLSNFGFFEYKNLFKKCELPKSTTLVDASNFYDEKSLGSNRCIGGILKEVSIKRSKNGEYGQLTIDCNYYELICIMWSEEWAEFKKEVIENQDNIIFVTGDMKQDSWKKTNVLQTNRKSQIKFL